MSAGHLHVRTNNVHLRKPLFKSLGLLKICFEFAGVRHDLIVLYRHLRPSMLQQLLRRLVFDVPQLTEYCKMPIKVS